MRRTGSLVVSMTSLMVPFTIPIFTLVAVLGMIGLFVYLGLGIMDFFSFGQSRWIRRASLVCLLAVLSGWLLPLAPRAESAGGSSGRVSLDFNDV